ncbi:MAG: hypothetical protein AB1428_07240 [Bacteroidota bacterium]
MEEKPGSEAVVREIKRGSRKKYSREDEIRIVLEGFPGEASINELCRREGMQTSVYYASSEEFLEVGGNVAKVTRREG